MMIIIVGGYLLLSLDVKAPIANEYQDSTATIDVSDWETYRNDEYGFEFKHPSDSTVTVRNDIAVFGTTTVNDYGITAEFIYNNIYYVVGVRNKINEYGRVPYNFPDLKTWIEKEGVYDMLKDSNDLSEYEETSVDGEVAYKLANGNLVFLVKRGDRVYNLYAAANGRVIKGKSTLYDAFVSSFKFTKIR